MTNIFGKLKTYFFSPRFHFSRFQFNLAALLFAIFGFLFATYFTVIKLPSVFALNDTTKTWTFNTANAGDYTYDNTLVTVDDTGGRPITGVNKLINPAFSSDTSSWSLAAVAGSTTPAGWVVVPGNSTYSTTDFLSMKYEAKCAATSDLTTGLTSPDSGYHTYSDSGTACTAANSKAVVSVASGYPIANITQTNSIARCAAVTVAGGAAHLISNNEWMTVARNAEAQTGNWSLGAVGGGYLYAGHNDNAPALAVVASTTDTGNNACAYTDTAGTTEAPASCPTNTANNTSGTAGNQKRVLTLSNGQYIWDIPGNVWEWTNDTITEANQPDVTGQTGFNWREFTALTSYGTLSYDLVRPAGSTYDATYGMGRIYHNSGSAASTVYGFLRGGGWDSTSSAGAFALNLSGTPGISAYYIGFRCASAPVAISQSFSSDSGRAGGGNTITIGSYTDAKLTQSINVGDTSTYDFSTYVYDSTSGNVGGTVSESIAQLYYNGATVTTAYTDAGSGWWKLSGTITGANASREFGILVKTGKTIKTDDFTVSKNGTYSVYNTTAYTNAQVSSWDSFTASVTATGNSAVGYQICLDNGSSCTYSSGSRWQYYTGGAWTNATDATQTNTAAQLTQAAMQSLSVTSQKISVKAIMSFGGSDTPAIASIAIGMTTDVTTPDTNASALAMTKTNGGAVITSNGWTNGDSPYFSWTAGADNAGGVGLKGYCLYLGADTSGNPSTAKGILGTSPVSTTGTTCQFIVSGTSIDFSTSAYKGDIWLATSSSPYYLNVKAVDNAGNIFSGSSTQFQFRFDSTVPTNSSYISCASGSFSNVADMNFSWPTSGSAAALDDNSGISGWQYQINSTAGSWNSLTTGSSYTLTSGTDGSAIVSGNNIIYFRSVDTAGNISSDSTIRTCNLAYGGAAPAFGGTDTVTVTPSTSTSNSYALSWPAATATSGQTVTHYYYMVNTSPPSTLATLQGNSSTYVDNGTTRTVSAAALANVNKGTNTVYVVAIDNASTPNYSPSNYISGTFTLNSTDPDNVASLVASDSSIKSSSQWNVTLTWVAPTYQGAGNLTYLIKRSTDNVTFTQVGTASGLSYVDNAPSSALYYYKVYTKDGADAESSGTNAVSITPTGKWTSAPTLSTGPDSGSITTKKATITWTTSRSADSKIQYGTTSGSYGTVEPSSSSQTSSHSIGLTGLNPGTTYYYKAKWTDEDGNTGTSDEKSFTTASAPTVKDVSAKSIGLTTATIQYTSQNASKVKIYYGTTTSFGGAKEVSTSTSETTYTTELTGLADGTKYYYKINTFDSESSEYEGTILDFTTLPRPRISSVKIQEVKGTAQPTILVSWTTNTEVSSIITYYPEGKASDARDEVNIALTKGEHKMFLKGLFPQTNYYLIVKGRDKIGNEAVSDTQKVTTSTDTRPPQILNVKIEGGVIPVVGSPGQESTAQLVVSWDTDELSTSQVEFGEGTGETYSQKTQEDSNLTTNHLVVISNLTPSKVYHLKAIAKDKAGNMGKSIDSVTITPKSTLSALDLVVGNLSDVFGFLNNVTK